MDAPPTPPRFNHVALTVPADALDGPGRAALLAFYGEVFGWTEMPTMTRDRELLVLRTWSHEEFVYLHAANAPMRCGPTEHVGMSVATEAELDALYERASKCAERDPEVELTPRTTEDFTVVKLHAFYVRYRLPVSFEVQCFAWAPGFGPHFMPG
jgi:hypothetical protein